MLIKICGVKSKEIAAFAIEKGAHLIGMILTPGYPRSITLAQAKEIATTVKKLGKEPVAVFTNETPNEVEEICEKIGVQLVQYYKTHEKLSPHLKRIYVNAPNAPLRENQDFLLMEGSKPGCGEQINPSTFTPPSTKFILAGGLSPQNVQEMIQHFRPFGVDVSSGVEKEKEKCPHLIEQFIKEVHACTT